MCLYTVTLGLKWLLKHFPQSNIVNIKRANDTLPRTPATDDIDIEEAINSKKLTLYNSAEIRLRIDETKQRGVILCRKTGAVLHEGDIFAATDIIPDHTFASAVKNNQKS